MDGTSVSRPNRDGAGFHDSLTLQKTAQSEEDAMAAVTRLKLGFVLAMAGVAAATAADAATIAGTVTLTNEALN